MAAADDFDDVVENRATGRGDDTYAARKGGELALAFSFEEAFGLQLVAELLVGELECACAARFERVGDELELAARLVDGDAAAGQDREAILRAKAKKLGLAAKEDNGELGFAILEREVDVAGGRGAAVGDLALNPEVGVGGFDALADVGDQGADGPDVALRSEVPVT